VRGGVVRRTGDRVGDALEMRTRRVGVDGLRSAILVVSRLPLGLPSSHSFGQPLSVVR